MTGDEAVPADFDTPEMLHHGVLASVAENAGPVHDPQDTNGYAAKAV